MSSAYMAGPDRKYLILVLYALFLAVILLRSYAPIGDWNVTHWLFNYTDGFVKRGVLGETLRVVGVEISHGSVSTASWALTTIAFVLLSLFFLWPATQDTKNIGLVLFFFVALTHPATFQHIIFDLGRFDVACLILALSSILMTKCLGENSAAIFVFFAMSVSILIHEASFFIYVPLVFGCWFYFENGLRGATRKLSVFFALFCVTYLVSTFGLFDSGRLAGDLLALRAKYGNWVVESSLNVIYHGEISKNIGRTINYGLSTGRLAQHLVLFVIVLAPMIFMGVKFYRSNADLKVEKIIFLPIVSALGPLALYPLGHDHFRWWSLAITNFFIALAVIASNDEPLRERLGRFFYGNRRVFFFIVVSSIVIGPTGVTTSLLPGLFLDKVEYFSHIIGIDFTAEEIKTMIKAWLVSVM
ncbi:hypothetical protein D3C78_475380 [compost metagenome]